MTDPITDALAKALKAVLSADGYEPGMNLRPAPGWCRFEALRWLVTPSQLRFAGARIGEI